MCGPMAAISPLGALMGKKPQLATALISPAAAALGAGKKRKDTARAPYDTPGFGG
jgi:hypothetical protein